MAADEIPAAEDADERHRLRIFVVEDHPDTRDMLCTLLEILGHEVVWASSMRDALAAIPAAGCDVLISDIGLPDGSGWELIRRLGGSTPRYAIAMSGYGMGSDIAASKAAGFRHHLVKPLAPEQLNSVLEEAAAAIALR